MSDDDSQSVSSIVEFYINGCALLITSIFGIIGMRKSLHKFFVLTFFDLVLKRFKRMGDLSEIENLIKFNLIQSSIYSVNQK